MRVRGAPADLLVWGPACYALKDRDRWLGWSASQRVERLEELVQIRLDSAASLAAAVQGSPWLIPQKTPEGVVHSYWTYVCRLADGLPFT